MKYLRRIALALVYIALAPVGAIGGFLLFVVMAGAELVGLGDIPEYPKESNP